MISWWKCKNPFFRKVTFSEDTKTLYIYNFGCNWACSVCTYRIKNPCLYEGCKKIEEEKILSIIKEFANEKRIIRVKFLGGEPLINTHLGNIAKYAKDLGLEVGLGHTNFSIMPPKEIESAVVSIKAIDESLHTKYTGGFSNKQVLKNFKRAYMRGMRLKTNTVFVPEFVDVDEIKRIAEFIASIDERIPLHIIGYMPVPGFPWRRPSKEEIKLAVDAAKIYLKNVTWSLPTIDRIAYPSKRIL